MTLRRCLIAFLAVGMAGCSNLSVKKIPIDKRIEGKDHVDGFRYYLSRPYVFVYEPIKVTERKSLVIALRSSPKEKDPGKPQRAEREVASLKFLDGPRRGEVVAIDALTAPVPEPVGGTRPLSPSELQAIRRVVEAPKDLGVRVASAGPDEAPRTETPAVLDAPTPTVVSRAGSGDNAPRDAAGPGPDTKSLDLPDLSKISTFKATEPRQSAQLKGPMQIVFLPDLDEQYAIKSKNFLSKTAFALKFKEGWQLSDVSASHDSTAVALALLDTIDAAVNAAKDIAIAQLPAAPKDSAPADVTATREGDLYYYYETLYIKPGVYRLNKPWEMECDVEPVGCGLLAKLGLTMVTEGRLLSAAEAANRDKSPKADP